MPILAKTSPPQPTPRSPDANPQGNPSESWLRSPSPGSPALSTTSTADGHGDVGSSPTLPSLPAPALPKRARELLRTPPSGSGDDTRFGTASWGSPYPRSDSHLRRLSFSSSDASEDSPLHQLEIDTRFLRPAPELTESAQVETPSSLTGAAAVLANRARRLTGGLTEDWIRTHTAGDLNSESRHWFSDGSDSEHSSLSGSDLEKRRREAELQTPRQTRPLRTAFARQARYPRAASSVDTLTPDDSTGLVPDHQRTADMTTSPSAVIPSEGASDASQQPTPVEELLPPAPQSPMSVPAVAKRPQTPTRASQKPLPKEPAMTPRLKKKVPWRGKNIMVLLPRDESRGKPGMAPRPMKQNEIDRMYDEWENLGYGIQGFDLLVEGYQPPGTDDAQSRADWPSTEDVASERAQRTYKVTLPDLNAWRDYVNELQEAKLRALGVFTAEEDPEPEPEPEQLVSPPLSGPSRQASAQYPPLPFSPPLPTSSAASNNGMPSFPFPQQLMGLQSGTQSPGIPTSTSSPFGAPGKFNARQSISFGPSRSPFQQAPDWMNQPGFIPGFGRADSPNLLNMNGMISPQSPFGLDGTQQSGSPAMNAHQRHQSLQYPMLPHQQFQQHAGARASPRLQEVREDEEEPAAHPDAAGAPEHAQRNPDNLQAEIDDAEYHLEEQLRTQLDHADYNPQTQVEPSANTDKAVKSGTFPAPELLANKPSEPLVLHHPRPHSRGHSLTQNMFKDTQGEVANDKAFGGLNDIPEAQKGDESYEIETNPSNLGTPVQDFDFAGALGMQHQKSLSNTSNPWNEPGPSAPRSRQSSHGSKPSFSKLNVKAPEFKFNPTNVFTPSGQFSFGGNSFQPAIFQTGVEPQTGPQPEPEVASPPVMQFGSSTFSAGAPNFSPGTSDFNFSASGPKFRPDAPAFTPFQSINGSVNSPTASGSESVGKTNSIFGPIDLPANEIVPPVKKSKAIPIVRPTSQSSTKSGRVAPADDECEEDDRPVADESRFKRARSSAPGGDEVPMFAEQPKDENSDVEEGEIVEDAGDEAEPAPPADISMSSTSEQQQGETKATTAAPSETSPLETDRPQWAPFEFDSKFDASSFSQAQPRSETKFHPTHKKSLSATAPIFTPSFAPTAATFVPQPQAASAPQSEIQRTDEEQDEDVQVSPVSPDDDATPSKLSREVSPPPKDRVVSKGLGASRFASPPSKPRVVSKGLAASRWVDAPSPEPKSHTPPYSPPFNDVTRPEEPLLPSVEQDVEEASVHSPTFEEIDDIMFQLDTAPSRGVNKTGEAPPRWHQPEADMTRPMSAVASSQPYKLDPPTDSHVPRQSASPTPRPFQGQPDGAAQEDNHMPLEDPFVDPPLSTQSTEANRQLSDWEKDFSEDEQNKLYSRAQFFDGRVNEVVGNLLASRLKPLEMALFDISSGLNTRNQRGVSSRRDLRDYSAELQESDADDEDDEPALRRSLSPRRDKRMEQIRAAIAEGFASQQQNASIGSVADMSENPDSADAVLKALAEMKAHLGDALKGETRGEELKNILDDALERKMPSSDHTSLEMASKIDELSAKIIDLEERLQLEREKAEKEIIERRAMQDMSAELNRKLHAAETRVEVEIINRSVFDQRVADLEERLRTQETKTEEEVANRRAAEDRLSENQRLLRISTEEETRLREVVEERDIKIKMLDQAAADASSQITLLDASQVASAQTQSELTNKLNTLEADLRVVRQDNHHWRAEAERADETARRTTGELSHMADENKHLQKSLSTLTTQLEENERLREKWRAKFLSLQEDMGNAARGIAEENASRIKKEQAMLARQEVLDARLQAEAKTRERLEVEMERLQMNERAAMRAVNESKRLEGLLGELKTENHKLSQSVAQHKRDYEEARDIGASEVKRVRLALQSEVDTANHQVNLVREELEEQNNKLRAEFDSFKLEADTAKARNEMLLEEAQNSKATEIAELKEKSQNDMENLQARYEHQLGTTVEEGQRTESHLLERLSFSASKMEHLQDRIVHLEEKLEVAKEAAAAAVQAAKSAGVDASHTTAVAAQPKTAASHRSEVPERISPQALRESIMVLQEQLQAREQRIEELEATNAKLDPDAPAKITKRDDEISWLRELLAVRHGDLQDIIAALSGDNYNRERVKDAAIRLKANLQMEEQERERALNGGSSLNLPNLVQSASPRVAQAVGPLAAAWGNWRKGSTASFSGISAALNSPHPARNATPSKRAPPMVSGANGGLMTPPASGVRQNPLVDNPAQPTAFNARRIPSQGSAVGRDRVNSHASRGRVDSHSSRRAEKMRMQEEAPFALQEPEEGPATPTMMRQSGYDSDAQPGDFDDDDFFED